MLVAEQKGRPPIASCDQVGDQWREGDPVGGSERLRVTAGDREHDVELVSERAEHSADERGMEERQVG